MIPYLFKIGPIQIGSYGMMMALAFLSVTWLLRNELRRSALPGDWAYSLVTAAIIGGVVGARIYFILEYPADFLRDPVGLLFSRSGLTWYGGLIGGLLAILWTARRLPVSTWRLLDLIAPLLLLGYGIGRIGCLLAGDGDYGPPTTLPWGMSFPNGLVPTYEKVHPTPIYETLISLTFFAILWRLRRKRLPAGMLTAGAFVLYGVERFVAEFWRLTPRVLWGWVSTAQLLSALLVGLGVGIGWWAVRRGKAQVDRTLSEEAGSVMRVAGERDADTRHDRRKQQAAPKGGKRTE